MSIKLPLWIAAVLTVIVFAMPAHGEEYSGARFGYLSGEGSFPADGGGGLIMPRAVSYYYDDNFLNTGTVFEGIFAGPYLSAASSRRGPQDSDLNIGGRLFTLSHFAGDYVKYHQGNTVPLETFNGSYFGGELFLEKNISDGVTGKIFYNLTKNNYYANGDTSPGFILPTDSTTQGIVLRLEDKELLADLWGEPKSGYRVWVDGGFYFSDSYTPWGQPAALSTGGKEYRQYRFFGGYYQQPFGDGKGTLALTANGRYGNGLDRLTMFPLGGISTIRPDSLKLHGYYCDEFFVDSVTLLNLEYTFPLLSNSPPSSRQLTGYLAYDWAMLPSGSLRGIGLGIKWAVSARLNLQMNYGYGFDAVRNGSNGGNSVTMKLQQVIF